MNKKRLLFLIILLILLLGLVIIYLLNYLKDDTQQPETNSNIDLILTSGQVPEPSQNINTLSVIVNPVEGGTNLTTQYFGNPKELEDKIILNSIATLNRALKGRFVYKDSKRITLNQFPLTISGEPVFNIASYKGCADFTNITYCESRKKEFDYVKFFKSNNICEIALANNIDEIWLLTAPFIGRWESITVGPTNEHPTNGSGTYIVDSCPKLYHVVNPTIDRTNLLLHSLGHRVESTIAYLFSNIIDSERILHWSRFSGFNDQPRLCGNVHFPTGATADYMYENQVTVTSNCIDWNNFPNYKNQSETFNCSKYGCSDIGWQEFWVSSLPAKSGTTKLNLKNGNTIFMENNWWKYLLYPQSAINFVNSPGISKDPQLCESYTYSDWGTCSSGKQTRSTITSTPIGCSGGVAKVLEQVCTSTAVPVSCINHTYNNWGTCVNNKQTRTVVTSQPSGCSGGVAKILEQACTATVIPVTRVLCGPIDANGDNELSLVDFSNFAKVYNKECLDVAPTTGCGGKDSNNDNKLNIIDLSNFAKSYNTSSCL